MKKQNSMLTGNPIKSIITFALPIMFSSLLQYNYTLVDNIIVGRYISTDALAAAGSVGPINSFIIGTALGLTSGFSIPVAHAFGAGDKQYQPCLSDRSCNCGNCSSYIRSPFKAYRHR